MEMSQAQWKETNTPPPENSVFFHKTCLNIINSWNKVFKVAKNLSGSKM